jgi:hypothetical protein
MIAVDRRAAAADLGKIVALVTGKIYRLARGATNPPAPAGLMSFSDMAPRFRLRRAAFDEGEGISLVETKGPLARSLIWFAPRILGVCRRRDIGNALLAEIATALKPLRRFPPAGNACDICLQPELRTQP